MTTIEEFYMPGFTLPVVIQTEEGFFFLDETAGLNGPYPTLQEAAFNLGKYVSTL